MQLYKNTFNHEVSKYEEQVFHTMSIFIYVAKQVMKLVVMYFLNDFMFYLV